MRERAYKHRIASLEQQIGSLQEQLAQEIHRSSSLMATSADRALSGAMGSPSPLSFFSTPSNAQLTNGVSTPPLTHEVLDRFTRTCATPASSVQSVGTATTTSGAALTPRSITSGAPSTGAGLTPRSAFLAAGNGNGAHLAPPRAIRSRSPSDRSGASLASRNSSLRSSLRLGPVTGGGGVAPRGSSVLTHASQSSTSSGARSLSNSSRFSQQTTLRVSNVRQPQVPSLPLHSHNSDVVIVASSSPPVRD